MGEKKQDIRFARIFRDNNICCGKTCQFGDGKDGRCTDGDSGHLHHRWWALLHAGAHFVSPESMHNQLNIVHTVQGGDAVHQQCSEMKPHPGGTESSWNFS